jgi:signal transduction histidine kinase
VKRTWLLLTLLAASQCCAAGPRRKDSLPVTDFSFTGRLTFASPPAFLVDSLGRQAGQLRRASFDVSLDQFRRYLRTGARSYVFWIRLPVRNNTDSILRPYFYCGDVNHVYLYFYSGKDPVQTASGGNLAGIHRKGPYIEQVTGSLPLRLLPHQSGEILFKIIQTTPAYSLGPIQVYDRELMYSSYGGHYEKTRYALFLKVLFMGFVLCQMLYVLFQWIIIRREEYAYYFLYLVAIAAYFFNKQETEMGVDLFFARHPMLGIYLDKALIILPYFLYFRFMRSFLDMKRNYHILNMWMKRMEYFLLAYLALDVILLLDLNLKMQDVASTIVLCIAFLGSVAVVAYLFTQKKTLIYYVLTGSFFVGLGNFIGIVLTYLYYDAHIYLGFDNFLVFSQVGIVIEIFCFTSGLSYKNKLSEQERLENQHKLIEQLKTNESLRTRMEDIRNKMARDLHDDVGATLSTILLYSNAAKKKIPENGGTEVAGIVDKIGTSALQMIREMNDIVWAINPRNDSMEKTFDRMRASAFSLLSSQDIVLNFTFDEALLQETLSMDKRQHCYLIFKEALNNLMKYARCTEVTITLMKRDNLLEMTIRDNGAGFDKDRHREGNGLRNMLQRAAESGGALEACTEAGKGTTISLRMPLDSQ